MTHIIISEWVNDECLTPSEQLFNHITIRVVAYRQDDSDVFFNMLSCYSANPLKQQSVNRHVTSLGYIILTPSQPVFGLTP
jgi:hypothetical protein